MRTTLAIDDDVLAVAKGLAAREGESLGAMVSALARQGMQRPAQPVDADTAAFRNGVPLPPVQAGASRPAGHLRPPAGGRRRARQPGGAGVAAGEGGSTSGSPIPAGQR